MNLYKLVVSIICVFFFCFSVGMTAESNDHAYHNMVRPIQDFLTPLDYETNLTHREDSVKEYRESAIRRFEIVFFISIPVSLFLSLGGTLLYHGISGKSGNFSRAEYGYLVLSTVGISFTVALHDLSEMKRTKTQIKPGATNQVMIKNQKKQRYHISIVPKIERNTKRWIHE